jgi:serine/threonine protein phosphatase PrpC
MEDPAKAGRVSAAGILLGVCDGMGGAAAGEVASRVAARALITALSKVPAAASRDEFAAALVKAIEGAGEKIREDARLHPSRKGMGTTCTAAAYRRGELFIGQVGDSRAYVYRAGRLVQVTKDQSLVSRMVELGHIKPEEASQAPGSNVILQALGSTEEIRVDLTVVSVRRGDRLLVCSDGLYGFVADEVIQSVLACHEDLDEACDKLIVLAKEAGGRDNISAVLCELGGEELVLPASEDVLGYRPYAPEEATSEVAAALAKPRPEERIRAVPSVRRRQAAAATVLFLAIAGLGAWGFRGHEGARTVAAPRRVMPGGDGPRVEVRPRRTEESTPSGDAEARDFSPTASSSPEPWAEARGSAREPTEARARRSVTDTHGQRSPAHLVRSRERAESVHPSEEGANPKRKSWSGPTNIQVNPFH